MKYSSFAWRQILTVTLLSSSFPLSTYAAETLVLKLPCKSDNGRCMVGMQNCSTVMQEVVEGVEANMKTELEFMAKGENISLTKSTENNPYTTPLSAKPLDPTIAAQKQEVLQTGQFVDIQGSSAVFGGASKPYGEAENSQKMGAYVRFINYFKAQALGEVIQQNQLTISNPECIDAAKEVEKLYQTSDETNAIATQEYSEALGENYTNFCNQSANSVDSGQQVTELCKRDLTDERLDARQQKAACYLVAARESTKTAFMRVATCKIFQDAIDQYYQAFGDEGEGNGQGDFFAVYKKRGMKHCKDRAKRAGKRRFGFSKSRARREYERCHPGAFTQDMITYLQDFQNTDLPPYSASRPNFKGLELLGNEDLFAGLFFPLIAFGGPRRRRRRLLKSLGVIVVLSMTIGACGGGGGGGGLPIVETYCIDYQSNAIESLEEALRCCQRVRPVRFTCRTCYQNSNGYQNCNDVTVTEENPGNFPDPANNSSCTEIAAVADDFGGALVDSTTGKPPQGCPQALGEDVADANTGASEAAANAAANLNFASRLLGKKQLANEAGSRDGQGATAASSDFKKPEGSVGPRGQRDDLANLAPVGKTDNSGGGSAAAPSRNGGSGLGTTGSDDRSGEAAATAGGPFPAADFVSATAGYVGGGGGGKAKKKKKSGAFGLFGRGGAGRGIASKGKKGKEFKFGAGSRGRFGSGDDIFDGTGEDADYLARIDILDNLFEVIEKRYRKEQMGWMVQDSSALIRETNETKLKLKSKKKEDEDRAPAQKR